MRRGSEQSGLFRSSFHKIMRKLDVSARDHRSGSGSGWSSVPGNSTPTP